MCEAADWYEQQGEGLGDRFMNEVAQALAAIEANPKRFAQLETLGSRTTFRRALVNEFPYVVVYRVFTNDVFVYAVAHAGRRPNYWKNRRRSSK
jgi:hypothetical protein